MASFSKGTSFTDGVTGDVTAAKLHALVDAATPVPGFITDRTAETSIATDDLVLISDTSESGALNKMTVANFYASSSNITHATGTAGTVGIGPTGDTNTGLFYPAADTAAISTAGSERVRVDSSGRVGIGETNPDVALSIKSAGASIKLTDTTGVSNTFWILAKDSSTPAFRIYDATNSTERLRIDSSGNVGIGTSSPSSSLHVATSTGEGIRIQSSTVQEGYILFTNLSGSMSAGMSGAATNTFLIYDRTNNQSAYSYTGGASGNHIFSTNNTERLRITSGGDLLVGTTTITGVGGWSLRPNLGGAGTYPRMEFNSNQSADVVKFLYSGTEVGRINSGTSSVSYVTTSDHRLKTNLEPISNGIDRIKQLPVYRFNWIIDQNGNKVDGFVAHEVTPVVPEAITGEKDAVDADGKPIYQGIDQSKIVPLLTAALKEAIAKIETLESKVAALEAA